MALQKIVPGTVTAATIGDLEKRAADLRQQKTAAETRLSMLQQQHADLVSQLKTAGVADIDNLEQTIASTETELATLTADVTEKIQLLEATIAQSHNT